MLIHKCDRCGKLAEQEVGVRRFIIPKGWQHIGFTTDATATGCEALDYELCPPCCKVLQIPAPSFDSEKKIGERLVEILEKIARGPVEPG